MKRATILRMIHEEGAFGMLCGNDGLPFAVTLERTFENQRVVIQDGVHIAKKTKYLKGGYETFEIEVPGHDRVLLHKGNVETDSLGCVLIGEAFENIEGKPGISQSSHGFTEFWEKYKDENIIEIDFSTVVPRGRS